MGVGYCIYFWLLNLNGTWGLNIHPPRARGSKDGAPALGDFGDLLQK